MQKLPAIFLILVIVLSLAACGEPKGSTSLESAPSTPTTHTHQYTETLTAATCTSEGYITYTCACGHTYQGPMIPVRNHNYNHLASVSAAASRPARTFDITSWKKAIPTL